MDFEFESNIVVNRLLEYAAVFACGLLIGTLSVISFNYMVFKGLKEIRTETSDTHIAKNISTTTNINNPSLILLPPKPDRIPRHIAVIMDGNRRYGRKTHGDPLRGHWVGGQTLVDFVQWCMEDGVEILTVYAFSSENWNRDAIEIHTLMSIFSKYSETLLKEATEKNVKVKILSTDFQRLPPSMQETIRKLEALTENFTGFNLNICLSYGGRAEITQACTRIAADVKDGKVSLSSISEGLFSSYLSSTTIPDPDLLIRTSGENRLSNFLCWQLAYTELLFLPKMWPEFSRADLREALQAYSNRARRYGV